VGLTVAQERLVLLGLLAAGFLVRAVKADQPIVENYVGRQIPTAMVARNLDRGSGFLRPQLDTGPFPNLFLVEPPIYELCVVALKRETGMPLEPAGRIVSALATALAAWGLNGLVRRREGPGVALVAVAAFLVFPVTIRYGRAFQPDALMLGTLLAGMRCWDEHSATRLGFWLAAGWMLLATALALKVTSAYILVPLLLVISRPRGWWPVLLAALALVPAALWYTQAAALMARGTGSAATENAAVWAQALVPVAWLRPRVYESLARFLVWRAFTPLGIGLGILGLWWPPSADRLWKCWALAASGALIILAGKLHHEYYFLALAPVFAVGVARVVNALIPLGMSGRIAAVLAASGMLGLSAALSASTWRTPAEWGHLVDASQILRSGSNRDRLIIAPEALLYMADRRGYRLEFTSEAAARALREWNAPPTSHPGPLDLIEFYREQGASAVAEVQSEPLDASRRGLHEALRAGFPDGIAIDRKGVLLLVRLSRQQHASSRIGRTGSVP
jgi:hypothetical protein